MTTPDPDKEAVYAAEASVFENTLYDEALRSDDLIRIANRLFATEWWSRPGIPVPIIEPTGAKDTTSYASIVHGLNLDPVIKLAPCHINARILAHEAAHVAQFYFYNPTHRVVAAHGREFRAAYVAVTEIVLGREAAHDLQVAFDRLVRVNSKFSPGKPDSLVTIPGVNPNHDPEGVGLLPAWRISQQLDTMAAFRPSASSSGIRINGAIAL